MGGGEAVSSPSSEEQCEEKDHFLDEPGGQQAGERIANLRMAFEVREGNNPRERHVPARLWGGDGAAQTTGPLEGVTLDVETLETDYLGACGWDTENCTPSRSKLESLGLADVADALKV